MLSLVAQLEPGPGAKRGGIRKANRKTPRTTPTTDTEKQPTRTTRKVGKLDLLPRRHVGRRRPEYRVELRLRRRQIIQVGVPKRF